LKVKETVQKVFFNPACPAYRQAGGRQALRTQSLRQAYKVKGSFIKKIKPSYTKASEGEGGD
jgi:hypothetical protein